MAIHLYDRSKMSGRGKADGSHGQAARVKRNAGGVDFVKNRRGGVALTFALTSPVLFGLVGGGIDYARLVAGALSCRAQSMRAPWPAATR